LTGPGEGDAAVVTDPLGGRAYPAADLPAVSLLRRQIGGAFRQVTEVLELRQRIGCTPQATAFQASPCPVISNVLRLIRGHVAAGRAEPVRPGAPSTASIFAGLREGLVSLRRVLGAGERLGCLAAAAAAEQAAGRLRELLGGAWSGRWRQAAAKEPRPPRPRAKQSGAQTSAHRILQQAKQQRTKPPTRPIE
jgi:hypothetical protein